MCRFSMIVPIYNVEKHLSYCIDSILKQTFTDFEVILVNDGSTDSCLSICRDYEKKDPRIRVIDQENQGLLMARKSGMAAAKGDYLVHVDSDDACREDLLEQLWKALTRTKADLVIYNYQIIDENNVPMKIHPPLDGMTRERIFKGREKIELFQKLLEGPEINNIWMKCASREIAGIFEDFTSYKEVKMGEDVIHSLPLLERAEKILYLPKPLYQYRVNSKGMSRKIQEEYIFHYLTVRNRVYEGIRSLGYEELLPLFWKRMIHGTENYLLKLHLVCNSGETYRELYEKVRECSICQLALKEKKDWGIFHRVMMSFCHPAFFYPARIFAKIYYGSV